MVSSGRLTFTQGRRVGVPGAAPRCVNSNSKKIIPESRGFLPTTISPLRLQCGFSNPRQSLWKSVGENRPI
ncbi:hypothetical protein C2E23DRAFT_24722 [Lenzites betulinus]|nr:hypothetical protein C2E23DRAFT_24722 [Lenzites betulinus]